MYPALAPGGTFPDYELLDHTGILCTLSGIQGIDPMILTLARGANCPKEHPQHLDLASCYPKITVAYTKVATITPDKPQGTQEFHDAAGAQWRFRFDPLDDPMIPRTLVLESGLIAHTVYNGYWFWGRPSTTDLWRDLRDMTREIQPDWDLNSPGLRDQWEAGDQASSYGWQEPTHHHDAGVRTGHPL